MIARALRIRLLRLVLRLLFGLPRPVKRLLAGPPRRVDGQELDLDVQLMGRAGAALSRGGPVGEAALAEQRRQVDAGAELTGPAFDGIREDVVTRDLTVPGAAGLLPARLYVPSGDQPPPGLLVYFHGGGFVLGSIASADPLCRLLAGQAGVRVLSVEYRLAPEHPYPAALDDALAAFGHAVAHAGEFGADPSLLAVGGDSAGGNLALAVAHQRSIHGGPLPAFVLAFYPATDVGRPTRSKTLFGSGFGLTTEDLAALELMYLPDGVPPDDARGALLRAEDLSGMPPVYLSTAGFDPLRDEGEELVERLRAAGVAVVARRFPSLTHAYAAYTAISRVARDATLDAASALRAGLALVAVENRARDVSA